MKNKYIAIIYKGCIDNESVREIHKKLYKETIENKYLLGFMIKLSNKAKKLVSGHRVMINGVSIDKNNPHLEPDNTGIAAALLSLFLKMDNKAKHIINHEVDKEAERDKLDRLDWFIDKSRKNNEWFYLASSHNDCAADHKDWQGRLYVDEKAPQEVIDYAKKRGLYTLQWVLGSPVWFVTRPNCRHYFVSLNKKQVKGKTDEKLKKRYHTHTEIGRKDLQTPRRTALNEYKDRLKMLLGMYKEYPTQELKIKINKTRLLVEKWENYSYNKK